MTLSDVHKARIALHSLPIEWDENVFDELDAFLTKAEAVAILNETKRPALLREWGKI